MQGTALPTTARKSRRKRLPDLVGFRPIKKPALFCSAGFFMGLWRIIFCLNHRAERPLCAFGGWRKTLLLPRLLSSCWFYFRKVWWGRNRALASVRFVRWPSACRWMLMMAGDGRVVFPDVPLLAWGARYLLRLSRVDYARTEPDAMNDHCCQAC